RIRKLTLKALHCEHKYQYSHEALAFIGERKQDYKVDQIQKLAHEGKDDESDDEVIGGRVSVYQHDGFVDLCRGPHVERTGKIVPFKLLSVAGAYWRGDESKPQLRRSDGTVSPSHKELDAYLEKLKEIERRDHRKLGGPLQLFRIDAEIGSWLVLWLPNGAIVREELENWWRTVHHERGYTLVYTPHIAHEKTYKRSGHLEKYGENMYGPLLLDDSPQGAGGTKSPHRFWIKPMNCPGHIKVFQSRIRSYRELPLRIREVGTVDRHERGGTLDGQQALRGFTQDDPHSFCT